MNGRRGSQLIVGGVALAALILVGIMFFSRSGGTPVAAPEPTRLPVATPVSPVATPAATPQESAALSPLATPQASPHPAPQASATLEATPAAPAPTDAAAVAESTAESTVESTAEPTTAPTAEPTAAPTEEPTPESTAIPVYTYEVVNEYPHDPAAFTQGLQFVDGVLYEGTGLRGRSSLRKVDLETGEVLQQIDLDREYFGEGIDVIGDRIYQLTWQNKVAFVYDRETFAEVGRFDYSTEGWGLTFDGTDLIMSDGTATLYRRNPETFAVIDRVQVQAGDDLVPLLNELEYVNGEVYANVWQTNKIARIDPTTGQVVGWVDLTGLLDKSTITDPVDVLNGIAYDAETDRLFVTGKLWPTLFEINLKLQTP